MWTAPAVAPFQYSRNSLCCTYATARAGDHTSVKPPTSASACGPSQACGCGVTRISYCVVASPPVSSGAAHFNCSNKAGTQSSNGRSLSNRNHTFATSRRPVSLCRVHRVHADEAGACAIPRKVMTDLTRLYILGTCRTHLEGRPCTLR